MEREVDFGKNSLSGLQRLKLNEKLQELAEGFDHTSIERTTFYQEVRLEILKMSSGEFGVALENETEFFNYLAGTETTGRLMQHLIDQLNMSPGQALEAIKMVLEDLGPKKGQL